VPPCWDDLRWLRDRWDGKLVIKGILRPEDALMALALGADFVFVGRPAMYGLAVAGEEGAVHGLRCERKKRMG
jgi:isopentenyl diphosphate isomerase/L-lactate dehydrogenase-like FMN-dependent dehydrogenase